MIFTIMFERDKNGNTTDPLMNAIRVAARKEKWTGMRGFKEWAKENYNATLRSSKYNDWTSISFKSVQDVKKFQADFVGYIDENAQV